MSDQPKSYLCIDPGVNMGVARFNGDGRLDVLETYDPLSLLDELRYESFMYAKLWIVLFEDSRIVSNVFSAKKIVKPAIREKIAQNVGEINQLCRLIKARCEHYAIPCYGISAAQKGKKLDAIEFKAAVPSWTGKSNQHERDAAML